MSLEDFQLLDNEPIDTSIVKRDLLKINHLQGAILNDPDQKVEFNFDVNNTYHRIGNAFLEFDITVRRIEDDNFTDFSAIRITNNAFASVFKKARLSTTSGGDSEHTQFTVQIYTIMGALTSEDGDLLSKFDNIIEGNGDNDRNFTALKKCYLTITM